MMRRCLLLVAVFAFFAENVFAEEHSPLGVSLKDIEVAEHWIYDDLPRAVAEAKQTGKPLLIVLRCVPCPPGRTLDEQVMRPTGALADLEKQFVCVRVIQTKGLDLDLFQYDFDMSWNAMFMNADQTIYGRYGTRTSSGHDSDGNLSAAAFAKAAERALELHKNYPANKSELAGKTGKPVKWKVPEDIPGLTDRRGVATERKNCIHCHMVKDYGLRAKWQAGELTKEDLFVYPSPQQIGLELDRDDGLLVKSVQSKSPAGAPNALKPGDELLTAAGQPLISTADLTWVLHQAPGSTTVVPLTVRRDGATVEAKLSLQNDWKRTDIAWRASSWYGLRQGLKLDPLPSGDPIWSKLSSDHMGALVVKGMFGKNVSILQSAGLKKGDVILSVDGKNVSNSESEFLVDLRTKHGPGDRVKVEVFRDGKTQMLTIPLW